MKINHVGNYKVIEKWTTLMTLYNKTSGMFLKAIILASDECVRREEKPTLIDCVHFKELENKQQSWPPK